MFGLPRWHSGKESTDSGSIPGSGRSPGKGNGNPLQYSCLKSSNDRRAWQASVHGITKNQTQLSDWASHACLRKEKEASGKGNILNARNPQSLASRQIASACFCPSVAWHSPACSCSPASWLSVCRSLKSTEVSVTFVRTFSYAHPSFGGTLSLSSFYSSNLSFSEWLSHWDLP